jgi:TonB family protein
MNATCAARHRTSPQLTALTALLLACALVATPAAQDAHQRLRDSAAAGDIEAIRILLTATDQVAIDATDALGWTALMYAADAGHDAAVRLLIDAGGTFNSTDVAQVTPLHLAARRGRTQVVQRLLEAGADFQARDADGRTPLFLAIDGRHADVIELLHGAARGTVGRQSPALALTAEDDTVPPVIIQWTDPPYTAEALAQEVEGTVVLMAIVRQDGSVGAVSVSKGLEDGLDQNAARSVRAWRFDPATRAGTPVPVVIAISVDFRLPDTPRHDEP